MLKPLYLLIQRDHYPVQPDVLTPITNLDIDRSWHDTIEFYATDKTSFHIPDASSDPDEAVCRFAPLFYCKEKNKFFHPPCPECAQPLDLFQDDASLEHAGLSAYNTSLKRYLYCPSCHNLGGHQTVYRFSRQSDDPAFVKDRFELIQDFGKLKGTIVGNFPCVACPEHDICYAAENKATVRIDFLSFYPFYMLLFDAAPIKAVNFIPFLSAQSLDDAFGGSRPLPANAQWLTPIQSGTDPFFFKNDNRLFLEILYLKLSLLERIARAVHQRIKDEDNPPFHLSAESIWITPAPQDSILPLFWNFEVRIIDLISNRSNIPDNFSFTGSQNLNFMACLWFYTLLVNGNQGPLEAYTAIDQMCTQGDLLKDCLSDAPLTIENIPGLALKNIFWDTRDMDVPEHWKQFWSNALKTGVRVLIQEKTMRLKHGLKTLINDVSGLKQEIKNELFSKNDGATRVSHATAPIHETKPQSDRDAEKRTAVRLLQQLKGKWTEAHITSQDTEDDIVETIVLSAEEDHPPQSDTNDTSPTLGTADVDNEETWGFDDMEETVVIDRKTVMPAPSTNEFTDQEETVIISRPTPPESKNKCAEDEDDPDKTIIILPKNK